MGIPKEKNKFKAIIIGATSGIGRELAKLLSNSGYIIGATGRRKYLLSTLKKEVKTDIIVRYMDISKTNEAVIILDQLINELDGLDLLIINAGLNEMNPNLELDVELNIISVNVVGFTTIATYAINYFIKQKKGHLVGISSIAALRGSDKAPAYPASKAYLSNYLQGLRKKVMKLDMPITVTDIKPGYIKTSMSEGKKSFWMTTVENACSQIVKSILKKQSYAYITKKWRIIAWIMRYTPDWIYNRL